MSAEKKPRELMACGSSAAYRRHLRRGEVACEECLKAHAAREKERWWRARGTAA